MVDSMTEREREMDGWIDKACLSERMNGQMDGSMDG